ncbi:MULTISPECIES: SDR family NAD(P)-dependent oxidoreductase [Actinoalloteichus]|uniref:SDR family NAD(P)-dependent oxidoreductase n=1 Tax=Actinoalloteichus TaxID=65496 RepID=UPI0003F954C2|nr:SDR family oxidoreductase [Actinoalloteichus caeruleus]
MVRNIVVTGGGTGIGLAVAARFASQGDSVTITGRRTDVLTEAANTLGARAVAFDASDPDAVTAALPALPDRVDVLINNAGGNVGFDLPAHDKDDLTGLAREWRANLATNVLSAVLVTTALTPRLADDGRVIMVGSIAARTGAGSYGASKAALEAWTIDVATRLGPRGITANLVSPGLIEDTEFFRGRLSDQRRATLISRTATGRAGAPDDIAATCAFLASPGAGHLTGQVLHVNGGAHFGR